MVRQTALRLLRVFAGASYRASRLASCVSVGLLRRSELEAAISPIWTVAGADGPGAREGLREWEERVYGSYLKPGERVLLIGCGSGRELLALARRGLVVEGLDPSAPWLAVARSLLGAAGLVAPLHLGRAETFVPDASLGAVVFTWFSYSYVPDTATRIGMLRRLSGQLDPGGRVILSYIPCATPSVATLDLRLARLASVLTRSDWRPSPGDVYSGDGALPIALYEHRFHADEIEDEVASAGLRVVAHERTAAALVAEPAAPLPDV